MDVSRITLCVWGGGGATVDNRGTLSPSSPSLFKRKGHQQSALLQLSDIDKTIAAANKSQEVTRPRSWR